MTVGKMEDRKTFKLYRQALSSELKMGVELILVELRWQLVEKFVVEQGP